MKTKRKASTPSRRLARTARTAEMKVNIKWPKGAETRLRTIGTLAGSAADNLNKLATAQRALHESLRDFNLQVEPAGITEPRFANLDENGTPTIGKHVAVRDARTGLEWSADIIGEANWADAKKLVSGCRLLGMSDWRLPTVQELLGLIDYSRCDPAVDPAHFIGERGWTWSSTPYAGNPSGGAWCVGLRSGDSGWCGQGFHDRVRAVRASQVHGLTE